MAKFLDLFAGCGGFSVGLKKAGLSSVGEVELDAWAADSLRSNFPESRILEGDVREFDDEVIRSFIGVDVIVGGPPCQGFSVAGASQFGIDDPRNELPHWFLHWVSILCPKIAIIENVPNILTKSDGTTSVLEVIKGEFERLGYLVVYKVLNAADYGTPQQRRRAFIVATAPGVYFQFPEPTHVVNTNSNHDLFGNLHPYVTVGEALSDLPPIEAGEGTDDQIPYATSPMNDYQKEMRKGSDGVKNHIAMRHTSRLIERFKVIGPGQSLKDVPSEHGQIAKITGDAVKKPFKSNNYRLDPSKPSLAIPASFQSLFLHPKLHRNLTAREAARIMGFPDNYEFKGRRTTMSWEKNLSQYNQIGNAVCPPVATALGRSILHALENATSSLPSGSVASVAGPRATTLTRSAPLPRITSLVDTEIESELTSLGTKILGGDNTTFSRQGFSVPNATLPAALIFAASKACPVCSSEKAPFGVHAGEIPFLISKENLHSLQENGQDHGLDYHLRALFNIPHQVGHLVGEQLAELGLVELVTVVNQRTGRRVRGMRLRKVDVIPASLSEALLGKIALSS
ncbi:DNA cytosine methyltransferase [Dechloromonas denitrificans]|uniref:DNA cytosine methyltransferase n=1 Tax=Dechloromonas denitrificans TaxID=281362 RepID=UPI001CF919C4|nr:DNA cytosine methyltransferase [Dechloromonas denitrificans]UCV01863.1 DNA cytosine methyltransferase [Dechloromonas denitrificans]